MHQSLCIGLQDGAKAEAELPPSMLRTFSHQILAGRGSRSEKVNNKPELKKMDHFLLDIRAEKKEEFEMLSRENASISRAYEKLQVISQDRQKRMEYEAREKAVRDYNQMMKESRESGLELGLAQGLERGRTEGLKRGREEGISIGEKRGSEQRSVDIAKKLLASGVGEKIIAESTGLSLAQIEELKE